MNSRSIQLTGGHSASVLIRLQKNWRVVVAVVLIPLAIFIYRANVADKIAAAKKQTSPAGGQELLPQMALRSYGKLPIYFASNRGQVDKRVKYYSAGAGFNFHLTQEGVTYAFFRPDKKESKAAATVANNNVGHELSSSPAAHGVKQERYALSVEFAGANPEAKIEGRNKQGAKFNYFMGSDPRKWQKDVSTFSKVAYTNLYSGIDLSYQGRGGKLKYEFVVAPNADPQQIRLQYKGADSLKVDKVGNLLIGTPWGTLKDEKPMVYQMVGGKRIIIDAAFAVSRNTVGFDLGAFDRSLPLVIDPGLVYSTFLAGNMVNDIAVDATGAAYVTGESGSHVFIAKLDPSGSALMYTTFVGGSTSEYGYGIAVDAGGAAYVTGSTDSFDFPTTAGAAYVTGQASWSSSDVFIIKLNSSGSALTYSTYLGGSGRDQGMGIAVDAGGAVYINGTSESTDFPTTAGAYDASLGGESDSFVAKLNASGSALTYSTYLGGSFFDTSGHQIAVDAGGAVYVTGRTYSNDFPTTVGAYDRTWTYPNSGGFEVFVTKLNPSGSTLTYSTLLGGSGVDEGYGIAIDTYGAAYVTGMTQSTNFPTTEGAYDATPNGDYDAFITKINPSGSALTYSTLMGGGGYDHGNRIVVDPAGATYVTGIASSPDFLAPFPTTTGAYDTTYNGDYDVFVTKVAPSGSTLDYSTFLGANSPDYGYGLAWDSGGAYVAGITLATDFSATATSDGNPKGFVAKLDMIADASPPPAVTLPITTVQTTPIDPDGLNGWFDSTPTVTLNSDAPGTTYYQWDSTSISGWNTYSGSMSIPEGQHTLYYFSVDNDNNAETVQARVFKVDTSPWQQVTADGFGDANNTLLEPTTVFNGYLYAGVADSVAGGEIWRSADGTAWEQVASGGLGDVNNDEVWPAGQFGGYLYAGTENYVTGGEVWRSADGINWEQVGSGGFGDPGNTVISPELVFGGELYAWTSNNTGVEMWRSSDGTNWEQANIDGFGDPNNRGGRPMIFNGYLYFGASNPATGAEVWKTADGTNWQQANVDGFGDIENKNADLLVFNDHLYAGTFAGASGAKIFRTSDGTSWEQAASGGFGDANNRAVRLRGTSDGKIYVGTTNPFTGTEIWRSSDGLSWEQVNNDGFGDAGNLETKGGFKEFNGSLYIGTKNNATGGEIWALPLALDTEPPTAPSLQAFASSDTLVDLYWQGSTDNIGVAGYRVYSATDDSLLASTSSSSYSFTGLTPGSYHSYYVKAYDAAGNVSDPSSTRGLTLGTGGGTAAGSGVSEVTINPTSNVALTFTDITSDGVTSVTEQSNPVAAPPSNFNFSGNQLEIQTTAAFTPPIQVAIKYDPATISGPETDLRLFHYEGGAWQDVTLYVDTGNNIIVGQVNALSPFILGSPGTTTGFTGTKKPFTRGHAEAGTATQAQCSGCHNAAAGGGFNAHATHQRTMWLSFVDKGDINDGCGKCHVSVATGYEGSLSYTDTNDDQSARRHVDPVICVSCHGRFKKTGVAGHAGAGVGSNCTFACHKPNGAGTASSAGAAHTGVSWINPAYVNNTTISNICLLCHGADGSTGISRRVWYQVEEGSWP